MADNVNITAGSGVTVSADDVGGSVLVQRVKVQYGADGSATDVSSTTPLPIDLPASTATAFSDTGTVGSITKYRGITVANTSTTTRAQVRIRNNTVAGTILSTITLAPGESRDDSFPAGRTVASGTLYMQLVSGTVEGSVFTS